MSLALKSPSVCHPESLCGSAGAHGLCFGEHQALRMHAVIAVFRSCFVEQLGGSCQEQRAKRNSFRVSSPSVAGPAFAQVRNWSLLVGWFIGRTSIAEDDLKLSSKRSFHCLPDGLPRPAGWTGRGCKGECFRP